MQHHDLQPEENEVEMEQEPQVSELMEVTVDSQPGPSRDDVGSVH